MAIADTWFWLLLGTSFASFLLAAKTHGQQLRLEREHMGFPHVTFGPRAVNPEPVERLWARDRRLFWSTVAIAALVLVPLTYSLGHALFPLANDWQRSFALPLLAGTAWSMTYAFLQNAILSRLRARANGRAGRAGERAWLASALGFFIVLFVMALLGLSVT